MSIAIHGWLEESECDKARNISQPPFSHFPNFTTWGPCRMIKTPSERGLDLGLRHNHKWDSKHNGWYNGYGGTTNSCENKPCFDSSLYMNTSQEFPGYPHSNILHGFYPSFHGEVKFHHMNHDQNSSDIQKTYPQDLPMISVPWVPWVPWVPSPWTISSEAFPVISSHCATIKRSVKLAVSTRSLYVSLGIGWFTISPTPTCYYRWCPITKLLYTCLPNTYTRSWWIYIYIIVNGCEWSILQLWQEYGKWLAITVMINDCYIIRGRGMVCSNRSSSTWCFQTCHGGEPVEDCWLKYPRFARFLRLGLWVVTACSALETVTSHIINVFQKITYVYFLLMYILYLCILMLLLLFKSKI